MMRKQKHLSAKVRANVLTIEIGIDTLAHAALHSEYTYGLLFDANAQDTRKPDERFSIRNKRGFANDVAHELQRELGEDGTTLLTRVLDDACVAAIEAGSEYFIDKEEG
jgi:hypothetical protein